MELELSEDQELFLETTRKLLAAEVPDPRGAGARVRSGRVHARRTGAAAPSSGWTSMLVPEADGGGSLSEHGLLDLVLVAEEMGKLVAPGPLVPVNVVAAAVAAAGSAEQKAAVLPGLLERRGGGGVDRPRPRRGRGRRATRSSSRAPRRPVEAGAQAPHLLVVARTDAGLTQVLVPADAAGLTVTPLGGLDLVRRFAEVALRRRRRARLGGGRRGRRGRRRGRAAAADRRRAAVRRDLRRHRPRLRDDRRVPRRPLLLRSAAVVVPGAEAPRRRREGVARGLPRHRHRAPPGRWPPARPTPASW